MSDAPQLWVWTVEGEAEVGGKFTVAGALVADIRVPSDFLEQLMSDAFAQLTQGKAEFHKPGQGGCKGPYDIIRIVIARA